MSNSLFKNRFFWNSVPPPAGHSQLRGSLAAGKGGSKINKGKVTNVKVLGGKRERKEAL